MISGLLQKYIWLVQTFIRAGESGLSLDEIAWKWEERFGGPYPRRTFNNHREAVEDVFGICIRCNRSTNRYYIECTEDIADTDAETAWLINTFTVNNILAMGRERLSGRVSVEDIPSGHRHLTGIMEAMAGNREITISYRKYTSNENDRFTLRPYAVKEFAMRWYVIAYCKEREALRVYGLDRIQSMEDTGETFRMPKGFDVDELFATSFGIYIPEQKGQTVIFRTTAKEARFIRDLPIHASQKELSASEIRRRLPDAKVRHDECCFEIFVCPNEALTMEFCRHGGRLEVLSPASVREAVATELMKAAAQYTENQENTI